MLEDRALSGLNDDCGEILCELHDFILVILGPREEFDLIFGTLATVVLNAHASIKYLAIGARKADSIKFLDVKGLPSWVPAWLGGHRGVHLKILSIKAKSPLEIVRQHLKTLANSVVVASMGTYIMMACQIYQPAI